MPWLYEINTWIWLEELSAAAGKRITLGSVPAKEWDSIAAWGFDLVYLMGVWERSAEGRRISKSNPDLFPGYDQALPGWTSRDVVGSGYSISNYVPDARIGTWDDLDRARAELRKRGMGLILDFVPNHMGPDHPWLREHPERFVQGDEASFRANPAAFLLVEQDDGSRFVARGRDPYFAPWPDTAQLNYFRAETRTAMIAILKTIAQHADGVRCDMAMLALNDIFAKTWGALLGGTPAPATEFWSEAIAAVKNPTQTAKSAKVSSRRASSGSKSNQGTSFHFMAEVYWDLEGRMQELGFDYTYDKRLYDRLRESSPGEVRGHLQADIGYQSRMARFLENHDEPRSAAVFPPDKLRAAAVAQATLPGMRFYHAGQFEGRRIHPPVQLARVAQEPIDQPLQDFYRRVLRLSRDDAYGKGEWKLLNVTTENGDPTNDNLIAYQWQLGTDRKLVIVNLGGQVSQGRVTGLNVTDPVCVLDDELNGQSYVRDGAEMRAPGLYVRLDAYGAHMFSITTAPAGTASGAAATR